MSDIGMSHKHKSGMYNSFDVSNLNKIVMILKNQYQITVITVWVVNWILVDATAL